MNRLTHRLPNKEAVMKPLDPDCGSCQNCKKQTRHFQMLIDRLAMHEDVAEQRNSLLTLHTETVCDKYCRYPIECKSQQELDSHCNCCELVSLWNAVITIEPEKEKENNVISFLKDNYCMINSLMCDEEKAKFNEDVAKRLIDAITRGRLGFNKERRKGFAGQHERRLYSEYRK